MLSLARGAAGENPDFSTWIALSAGVTSAGFAVWQPKNAPQAGERPRRLRIR